MTDQKQPSHHEQERQKNNFLQKLIEIRRKQQKEKKEKKEEKESK